MLAPSEAFETTDSAMNCSPSFDCMISTLRFGDEKVPPPKEMTPISLLTFPPSKAP